MVRRNRIPYDPPHARKTNRWRRSGVPSAPEQLFMSRRMFLAKGTILAAFGTLAAKLAKMQIIDLDQYRQAAAGNRQYPESIKPTRGRIWDRTGRELAINEQTWEVRILPNELPSEGPAREQVLDELINALNLPDALILDPRAVPDGEESTVYARAAQLLGKSKLDVEVLNEAIRHPGLTESGRLIQVNGQELQVFLYPSIGARVKDWQKIIPEQGTIDGMPIGWAAQPHFFTAGNVIAILLSPDLDLTANVGRAVSWLQGLNAIDEVAITLRDTGWSRYIQDEEDRNYLIRLEDDLTTDQAALCRAHMNELPGVQVMNRLRYLVENGRTREKVVVQTGVPRDVALKLEANKQSLSGVELDGGVFIRRYPGGESMSHILGYVGQISETELDENTDDRDESIYSGDDWIGKDGLEYTMEERLRGRHGMREVAMDAATGSWRVIEGSQHDPTPGDDLELTIDLEFQQAVSEILRDGIRYSNDDRAAIAAADPARPLKQKSGAGAVVALDPRNGEVLAMVSYPHYNNQLFVDGIAQRKYQEYVSDEANKPLLDRALRGEYPPGSTLKTFLAAAALDERTINPETTYTCTGAIQVPNQWDASKGTVHPCWKWETGGHQSLDVFSAIEQSCDVFFYNVGAPRQQIENSNDYLHYRDRNLVTDQIGTEKHYFEGLGIQRINDHLEKRFRFGSKTGIELPAEATGVVPDGEWLAKERPGSGWSVSATITVSIGQGDFLTTPLQLALNTAALANGGLIHKPRLLRAGEAAVQPDATGSVKQTDSPEPVAKTGYTKEVLDVVREGMRRVVQAQSGTASRTVGQATKWPLTNPPGEPEIVVAGKTGTAEIGEQDEQGLYERQHAWFSAFAPLDDPEIAVAVLVEDGGEGTTYAVPVTDRVLRAYFELAGKRPRGAVLRREEGPTDGNTSILGDQAAFPTPGESAEAGVQPQD